MIPRRNYPVTVLSTIVALVGMLIAASVVARDQLPLLLPIVVIVINNLIATAQNEGNGHRITSVEKSAAKTAGRLDDAEAVAAAKKETGV